MGNKHGAEGLSRGSDPTDKCPEIPGQRCGTRTQHREEGPLSGCGGSQDPCLPSVLILRAVLTSAKRVALKVTVPSLFRGMFMHTRRCTANQHL